MSTFLTCEYVYRVHKYTAFPAWAGWPSVRIPRSGGTPPEAVARPLCEPSNKFLKGISSFVTFYLLLSFPSVRFVIVLFTVYYTPRSFIPSRAIRTRIMMSQSFRKIRCRTNIMMSTFLTCEYVYRVHKYTAFPAWAGWPSVRIPPSGGTPRHRRGG